MEQQTDLGAAFDAIAGTLKEAAAKKSWGVAESEAERQGLAKQGDDTPRQKYVWIRTDGSRTLEFTWRWYDQSKPFSIQPDMNMVLVELKENGRVIRQAEERFED